MSTFDTILLLIYARVCYGVALPDPFFVDTFYVWRLGIATLQDKFERRFSRA